MPILWRYALQSYTRVLLLSICTFIAVLIVSRFKEIARFTALTCDFRKTGMFVFYQIPAILPIAIPISTLIASLLLFQKLSRSYELTALRASGLSLRSILAPLLSRALKKNRPRLDINALSFKMLSYSDKTKPVLIERLRRLSLSLAVFSFTLLGCTFGIDEARRPSRKNLLFAFLLTLTVLMSYLLGKELKNHVALAIGAFLLPHPFIWFCSFLHLHRISRGRI